MPVNESQHQTEPNTPEPGLAGSGVAALFIGAIIAGSFLGLASPEASGTVSGFIDQTLLLMIFLLCFELRPGALLQGLKNLRFLGIAWGANFLVIPVIGFAIATVFLSNQPVFYTGLLIYFLAPCTDWFLGFTRMAKGDTALGAALIPINMLTQLLLFPVWLWLFTRHTGVVDLESLPGTLMDWFLVPLLAAQALRFVMEKVLPEDLFARIMTWVGHIIPVVIAALILQIFAGNIVTIADHAQIFGVILVAIFLFFVVTYFVVEGISRVTALPYEQHALLTMTTAARNAPMMLAVTAVAIPGEPLILAALVIGMLVEFPHLTAMKQLLLRQRNRKVAA